MPGLPRDVEPRPLLLRAQLLPSLSTKIPRATRSLSSGAAGACAALAVAPIPSLFDLIPLQLLPPNRALNVSNCSSCCTLQFSPLLWMIHGPYAPGPAA